MWTLLASRVVAWCEDACMALVFRKRGKLKRIWAERSAERREIRRNLPETQKRG